MAWIEVFFQTTAEDREFFEDWLTTQGALAVTYAYADPLDRRLWEPDPELFTAPEPTEIVGLFEETPEFWDWIASACRAYPQIQTRKLPDTDWARACQQSFPAKRFGQRLWVCPSWEAPPADPDAVILRLDPGIAFGTGSHPTTTLCLEALEAMSLAGKTILDYGCGSGILALAACLLGAQEAWAIDHCPQALESARSNAAHAGLEARIHIGLPDTLPSAFQADILCANILAEPLITLAPSLLQQVRPGGRVILSGFLAEQCEALYRAYAISQERAVLRTQEEWCCLEFQV